MEKGARAVTSWLLTLSVLLATACAVLPGPAGPAPTANPDLSGVLRLMGRFTTAHACPVEDVVLTAAHVLDLRPFDREMPLFPYRFSDGLGNEGILEPVSVERCADLGVLKVRSGSVRPYRRAKLVKVGEPVSLLGYDWRDRGRAYGAHEVDAVVTRIVAGNLILSESGDRGSSGSCVLNAAGEVVGINAWGTRVWDGEVGGVVGVWGEWRDSCR